MSAELPDSLYVSIPVASRILGIHRQTLEKAIARGEFVTKQIAGREMVLTSSLLPQPEPMTLWWRHRTVAGGGIGDGLSISISISISCNEATVEVRVVGTMRGLPVEHTDARRLIPADLPDRRIVAEELRAVLSDALDHTDISDRALDELIQDVSKNLPENRPAQPTARV